MFLWIVVCFTFQNFANGFTTPAPNQTLSCYDCSEAFKYRWEPYTECQAYPTSLPLRECLGVEKYCKVERTTYRSMTVSITRSCTKECWYGCYASGYGLTKLKCTSCCQESGCNTDNSATTLCTDGVIVVLCFYIFGFVFIKVLSPIT